MRDIARSLAADEELVVDVHPHWRRLVVPFLAVPVVAGATTFALLRAPATITVRVTVLVAAVVLLVVLSAAPYLRWRATRYLVTDRRVLAQSGVLTRRGHDVPLERVDEIRYERSTVDRLTRCGDLVLESVDAGFLRLVAVPRVRRVHEIVTALVEGEREWADDEWADGEPVHDMK